jgi:hypothetical protein
VLAPVPVRGEAIVKGTIAYADDQIVVEELQPGSGG